MNTSPLGNPCTAKERRDFLVYYAGVMLREYRARFGTRCNEWMLRGAVRSLIEAAGICVGPAQMVLL